MRHNFSRVARYSLKFTRCSLHVVKSLVTRCKIRLLLVAEVTRCENLLVISWRSCLLQKFIRYSLQNSLVTRCKIRSLLVAKFARYSLQKLLVAKNNSLIIAKFACCSLQKLLVAKNNSLLVAKFARHSLQKLLVTKNHSLLVAK